jgi:hypothetical protein
VRKPTAAAERGERQKVTNFRGRIWKRSLTLILIAKLLRWTARVGGDLGGSQTVSVVANRPLLDSFLAMAFGSSDALVRGRVSHSALDGECAPTTASLLNKPYAPSDNPKKL